MPVRFYRPLRLALAACLVFTTLACQAFKPYTTDCEDGACPSPYLLHKVKVVEEPTVMALAHDLDILEKHIDWYGSVVPKVPDVWGQARLTKHREDFEDHMQAELGNFTVNINGSLTRADSSYFAQAVALGIAAQPSPRRVTNGTPTTPPNGVTTSIFQPVLLPPPAVATSKPADATSTATSQTLTKDTPSGVTVVSAGSSAVALIPEPTNLTTNALATPRTFLPSSAIALEPTLMLEQ